MGKVKAWIMDLEEQFYDKVDESDLCVRRHFEEFVAIAKEKIGDAMSPMIFSMLRSQCLE